MLSRKIYAISDKDMHTKIGNKFLGWVRCGRERERERREMKMKIKSGFLEQAPSVVYASVLYENSLFFVGKGGAKLLDE